MKTNWTSPKKGATLNQLYQLIKRGKPWDWDSFNRLFHLAHKQKNGWSAKTNLAITTTGELEQYDFERITKCEI